MQFHNPSSEIFVPDQASVEEALGRTTHLAIGAHQDDIEFMAYHGIQECFGRTDRHFSSVTVTNGAGSPRAGSYAHYSDEEIQKIRRQEQKKAARIGNYSAHVFLDYSSAATKNGSDQSVVRDLEQLLRATSPEVVYTHNLADKHDTHVATTLRVIEALRRVSRETKVQHVYGCEVWRSLDWLNDEDKIAFNVEGREDLAAALAGVFDSQISGGKRYDLAVLGRRRANATFSASHGVDTSTAIIFAMDLTPLIQDESLDIGKYVQGFIESFKSDVEERIARLGRRS